MKGSIKVSDDSGYSKDKSGRQIRYGDIVCITLKNGKSIYAKYTDIGFCYIEQRKGGYIEQVTISRKSVADSQIEVIITGGKHGQNQATNSDSKENA